jgi:predicted nucleic acid-binding protein
MIFLDANIFLRALTQSSDPVIRQMHEQAAALLRQTERGDVEVTTTDAVIAEVAFILTAKRHYQLPVGDAAARIATLLRLRGTKLRDKRVMLRALDLWADQPRLGFVDALTASYAQQPGVDLATFDSDFDQIPEVTRWQPEDDIPTSP